MIENKERCIRKNIFTCLFSDNNTISLSCHEQVYMFNTSLNILVHDVINLLYKERCMFREIEDKEG